MSKRDDLCANDAVWAAFYRDGKTFKQICEQFDCGVYDLSPWLVSPLSSALYDNMAFIADRLPYGHIVIEQADMPDGRVSQTVRDVEKNEYERVVHADEAYGREDEK